MGQTIYITDESLERRFKHHEPNTEERAGRHSDVRAVCLNAAKELVRLTGEPSREQTLAITKLEEVMYWCNAAIARETR